MKFSLIIPLYNRPQEIYELLGSLTLQTYKDFEVIVVEDGSLEKSEKIVDAFRDKLDVKYFFKENSGPGLTRNFGASKASGDYFIFFDSDCIIPPKYMEVVSSQLNKNFTNTFGGPDATMDNFTDVQKAIGYAMTSIFTTGGIRGANEKAGKFHPRSFNMGICKGSFEAVGGYSSMRFGEDIDLTLRLLEHEFTSQLIKDAFVYHKRRTDFKKFFRQVFNSGCARINLFKRHPKSLKLVHLLPSAYTIANILFLLVPAVLCSILFFLDSLRISKNIKVAFLSLWAANCQLFGYGLGFLKAFWCRIILKKQEDTVGFVKNFYK